MNRDTFLSDLQKLLNKHKVFLSGKLRISDNKKTQSIEIIEIDHCDNGVIDSMGPFLHFQKEEFSSVSHHESFKMKTVIMDRDKLLADGVISPIDQKSTFHNRRDWANHLKANNCVEFGNDLNNAKIRTDIRGDFDCRKELAEATHQVMEKYGN